MNSYIDNLPPRRLDCRIKGSIGPIDSNEKNAADRSSSETRTTANEAYAIGISGQNSSLIHRYLAWNRTHHPANGETMNTTQIQLVQQTWAHVVPISEQAAELFYCHLFELDPEVRTLFHGDMKEQGRKLVTMIDTAVKGLNNLDKLAPALRELGKRHAGYGVTSANYGTVGMALLWTLEKSLGEAAFTPDVREAWTSVYGVLATTMQTAASP